MYIAPLRLPTSGEGGGGGYDLLSNARLCPPENFLLRTIRRRGGGTSERDSSRGNAAE